MHAQWGSVAHTEGKKARIKAYFNANWVWNNASFMFLCTHSHCDDKGCYQKVHKSHTEERMNSNKAGFLRSALEQNTRNSLPSCSEWEFLRMRNHLPHLFCPLSFFWMNDQSENFHLFMLHIYIMSSSYGNGILNQTYKKRNKGKYKKSMQELKK